MIDSHSHVDAEAFDADRAETLQRARDAGVTRIVDPGCDLLSSERAVSLAAEHDFIYAAVGVHPHSAGEATPETMERLGRLAQGNPRVVAVGETGLDYFYNFSPPEMQRDALRRHVRLAYSLKLPLIVHCREAEEDLLDVLRETNAHETGGVIHCFTGPWELARRFVAMGFHIGVTGIATFKKTGFVTETARSVPLDRLLIETDAPYLAPHPHRGKRNEPAYLADVLAAVASARGESIETIEQATAENATRLFRLG